MKRLTSALPLLLAACIPDEAPPAVTTAATSRVDPHDTKGLLQTVDALEHELKGRARDFGINLALGNLYADNGRYVEALGYYRDAEAVVAGAEASLSAAPRRPPPPADCLPRTAADTADRRSVEQVLQLAAARGGAEGLACLAGLSSTLAQLHARQGNAWYLAGNADKARERHERALRLDPDEPESLFFRGADLLESSRGDVQKREAGRAAWERLVKVAADHPRAAVARETLPHIDELFGPKATAPPAAPPPLPEGAAAASAAVERTPGLAQQLDARLAQGERLLADAKWQEALDTFKAVMPLRPDGRVALGMGIALRELGRPTAERVLTQATRLPGGDASRATYELAVLLEKQNRAKARSLLESLAADPAWGPKAQQRLAGLR
jgi:tetratricopeptide (TPR) repeat protein